MKRALAAVAVVLSAMAAAALPGEAQTETPRRLRVGVNGWENNLTPFTITFASQPTTIDLLNLVYDTLFWSQARPDPEPWLAEEANPSADRKTWTVKLRSGVEWHDGRPFTAEDVKFTFEYFKRHAGRTGRYGHHVAEVPAFERGHVLSPTQVRLIFKDPLPAFRILPGADLPMLPKHIWQTVDDPSSASTDLPVGTGPFTVTEMTGRERYRLKANPGYFKGKPLLDEIALVIAGDPNVSFNDLVAGKLDLVASTVPPIFVDQLTANPELKVVRASRMESVQLNFNARKQPLSDPKLRKAISLAIDNQVLTKSVTGGRGRPGVDSFVHPESAWADPGAEHEFNVGKANQILDSAGYSRKDSDGIRKGPDGKRLTFSALFSTLEPQSLQSLQLISQMTTAIGVRMEPEPATPSRLRAVRRPAPQAIPEYDAYVSQLEVHTHSDPDGLLFFFHSPGKGMGAQITGYSNPEFDRLLEDSSTTVHLSERKRKLHEAQRLFAEEVPSLSLFYPDGVYAFRPGVYDGWVPDPGQGIFTKRSFLEDYAKAAGGAGTQTAIPPAWVFLGGVAALVMAGTGMVLLRRRPATVLEGEDTSDEGVEETEHPPAEAIPAGEAAAVQASPASTLPGEEDLSSVVAGSPGAFAGPGQEALESVPPPGGLWQPQSLPEPPRWPSFIGSEQPPPPQGPPPVPPDPGPPQPVPESSMGPPPAGGPVERLPGEGGPVLPPVFGPAGESDDLTTLQIPPLPQLPFAHEPATDEADEPEAVNPDAPNGP